MSSQWSAVYTERSLALVVLIPESYPETARLGKVYLVRSQGKLPADSTPYLNIYLWPVEGRLVRDLHVGDLRIDEHLAYHVLGLLPELSIIYVFLTTLFRSVGG